MQNANSKTISKRFNSINNRHKKERNKLNSSIGFNRNMQTQRWAHNKRQARIGSSGKRRRVL
jgi:hypothetical protein